MPNYFNAFNIFECGRKLLDRLDVSYKIACMATPKEEYFTEVMNHINTYDDRHSQILSSKKLRYSVIRVTQDEEEEI